MHLIRNAKPVEIAFFAVFFLSPALKSHAIPLQISLFGGLDAFSVNMKQISMGEISAKVDYNFKDDYKPSILTPVWGAGISGSDGKNYVFSLLYARDPLWADTLRGSFGLIMGIVHINLGFQLGIPEFNFSGLEFPNADYWDPGLSGEIKLGKEGYCFVSASYASSLRGESDIIGSTIRQWLQLKLCFWVPYIYVTFAYSQKDFSRVDSYTTTDEDGNTTTQSGAVKAGEQRIYGNLEFYAKNIPFRINFGAGSLVNSLYFGEGEQKSDRYIYFSAGFTIHFGEHFSWFAQSEVPFTGLFEFKPGRIFAKTGVTITVFGSNN